MLKCFVVFVYDMHVGALSYIYKVKINKKCVCLNNLKLGLKRIWKQCLKVNLCNTNYGAV